MRGEIDPKELEQGDGIGKTKAITIKAMAISLARYI